MHETRMSLAILELLRGGRSFARGNLRRRKNLLLLAINIFIPEWHA
jgi:hypothetical protein